MLPYIGFRDGFSRFIRILVENRAGFSLGSLLGLVEV